MFTLQTRFRVVLLALVCWLALSSLTAGLMPGPVAAVDEITAGQPFLFKETGHTLAYNFRQTWEQKGGLAIFGYPLTEVFLEDGLPVQYFERARLEWHADLGLVQLGLLGNWVAARRRAEAPFKPVAPPATPSQRYFGPTGHFLSDKFAEYWADQGGLPVFGYPISEEFSEVNHEDGHIYQVQYFERARFEYHPDLPAGSQVLLGQLGRLYLEKQQNAPVWATAPVDTPATAWQAFRPTHIRVPRVGLDTDIVEGGLNLAGWDVPRYTAVHYWPVSAFPGSKGNIVMAGHAGYKNTIFDQLPQVAIGDQVILTVGLAERLYRVYLIQVVEPTDSWVLNPAPVETLTLITCVPPDLYNKRLIVRAEPVKS